VTCGDVCFRDCSRRCQRSPLYIYCIIILAPRCNAHSGSILQPSLDRHIGGATAAGSGPRPPAATGSGRPSHGARRRRRTAAGGGVGSALLCGILQPSLAQEAARAQQEEARCWPGLLRAPDSAVQAGSEGGGRRVLPSTGYPGPGLSALYLELIVASCGKLCLLVDSRGRLRGISGPGSLRCLIVASSARNEPPRRQPGPCTGYLGPGTRLECGRGGLRCGKRGSERGGRVGKRDHCILSRASLCLLYSICRLFILVVLYRRYYIVAEGRLRGISGPGRASERASYPMLHIPATLLAAMQHSPPIRPRSILA
jgi:hypothetical protein